MRPKLAIWLTALCLAGAPALAAADAPRATPAEVQRRPASADELAGYAEREQQAKPLEDFEGGRRRGGTEATTIIIILLVVILVVVLV